jgi:hypothetical protein
VRAASPQELTSPQVARPASLPRQPRIPRAASSRANFARSGTRQRVTTSRPPFSPRGTARLPRQRAAPGCAGQNEPRQPEEPRRCARSRQDCRRCRCDRAGQPPHGRAPMPRPPPWMVHAAPVPAPRIPPGGDAPSSFSTPASD